MILWGLMKVLTQSRDLVPCLTLIWKTCRLHAQKGHRLRLYQLHRPVVRCPESRDSTIPHCSVMEIDQNSLRACTVRFSLAMEESGAQHHNGVGVAPTRRHRTVKAVEPRQLGFLTQVSDQYICPKAGGSVHDTEEWRHSQATGIGTIRIDVAGYIKLPLGTCYAEMTYTTIWKTTIKVVS